MRHVEIRLPVFWYQRQMFETASHTCECSTEDVEKQVRKLQAGYSQEAIDYLQKALRSVAVLVDGVATQVPVKSMKLMIELDLSSLETEKTLSVPFGSKLHELLYLTITGKLRRIGTHNAKGLAQLHGADYLTEEASATEKGHALLAKYWSEGPTDNRGERRLCKCLLELISPSIRCNCNLSVVHNHLFEHEYLTGRADASTKKGTALLARHADHVMTLKGFVTYRETLVSFLSKDKLPEYLTSDNSVVRDRAVLRYDTLEEEEREEEKKSAETIER